MMVKRNLKMATCTAGSEINQSLWEHVRSPLVRFLLKGKEGKEGKGRRKERKREGEGARERKKPNAYKNDERRFT